ERERQRERERERERGGEREGERTQSEMFGVRCSRAVFCLASAFRFRLFCHFPVGGMMHASCFCHMVKWVCLRLSTHTHTYTYTQISQIHKNVHSLTPSHTHTHPTTHPHTHTTHNNKQPNTTL